MLLRHTDAFHSQSLNFFKAGLCSYVLKLQGWRKGREDGCRDGSSHPVTHKPLSFSPSNPTRIASRDDDAVTHALNEVSQVQVYFEENVATLPPLLYMFSFVFNHASYFCY